jgi:hypothetical protein
MNQHGACRRYDETEFRIRQKSLTCQKNLRGSFPSFWRRSMNHAGTLTRNVSIGSMSHLITSFAFQKHITPSPLAALRHRKAT